MKSIQFNQESVTTSKLISYRTNRVVQCLAICFDRNWLARTYIRTLACYVRLNRNHAYCSFIYVFPWSDYFLNDTFIEIYRQQIYTCPQWKCAPAYFSNQLKLDSFLLFINFKSTNSSMITNQIMPCQRRIEHLLFTLNVFLIVSTVFSIARLLSIMTGMLISVSLFCHFLNKLLFILFHVRTIKIFTIGCIIGCCFSRSLIMIFLEWMPLTFLKINEFLFELQIWMVFIFENCSMIRDLTHKMVYMEYEFQKFSNHSLGSYPIYGSRA